MTMSPRVRKSMLAGHLTFSIGWIGAVVAYLALGVAAVSSTQVEMIRAAWTAMEIIGWYVIVPLALASLLSGLTMALGTSWGLIRHYWVLISFLITVFATAVLITHMPDVSYLADVARRSSGARLESLGGDFLHAGFGLALLLVVQVLNVYKPRGITRHGWRKQQQKQRQPSTEPRPKP